MEQSLGGIGPDLSGAPEVGSGQGLAARQPGLGAVPAWAAGVLAFVVLAAGYSAWLAFTKSGGGVDLVVQLAEIILGPVLAGVVGLYLVGRVTLFGSRTTGQVVVAAAVLVIAVAQLATQIAAPTVRAAGEYVPSAANYAFSRDSELESRIQAQTAGTDAEAYASRLRVFDFSHAGSELGVLEVYDLEGVSGLSSLSQEADAFVGRNLPGAASREFTTLGRTVILYEAPGAGIAVWMQGNLLLETIATSGTDAENVARALAGEAVP